MRRLIREKKLHHHAARFHGPIRRRFHDHIGCGLADAEAVSVRSLSISTMQARQLPLAA